MDDKTQSLASMMHVSVSMTHGVADIIHSMADMTDLTDALPTWWKGDMWQSDCLKPWPKTTQNILSIYEKVKTY